MSDTDYKQFMNHGELASGLDVAIYQKGYMYHTKQDAEPNLPAGVIQHMGQNALDIVRHMAFQANLNPVQNGPVQSEMTYFDILGYTLVVIPMESAIWLARGIVVCSVLFYFSKFSVLSLRSGVKLYLRSLGISLGYCIAFSTLLYAVNLQLLWFRNEFLPLAVYAPLVIYGSYPISFVSSCVVHGTRKLTQFAGGLTYF
jgi:hypothetical protein